MEQPLEKPIEHTARSQRHWENIIFDGFCISCGEGEDKSHPNGEPIKNYE